MIVPNTDLAADAVGHHYDELDAFYRAVWGEHVHHGYWTRGDESVEEATEALALNVAHGAQVQDGDRVVDVGCGYGGTARFLANHFGAEVTGLTLSTAQAEYARQQPVQDGAIPPTIQVRDWLDNGLPDSHFDAAIAIESTTHMPDRPRVFAEIARVLKPGGRLALCVWMTEENPPSWAERHLLEPICREGRLYGMGSPSENRAWIEEAGFEIESFDDISKHVAKTWTICLRRVAAGIISDAAYRRFLLDARSRDRVFARTLGRIWLAYKTGAMRYGFVVARRKESVVDL